MLSDVGDLGISFKGGIRSIKINIIFYYTFFFFIIFSLPCGAPS